jgi:hypothetical protein
MRSTGKPSGWVVFHDRACAGRYPVTPKDTLATFGCARHTGNDGYCVALDDLLAHADEVPGTCAEPFETAPGCGLPPSLRADSGVSRVALMSPKDSIF